MVKIGCASGAMESWCLMTSEFSILMKFLRERQGISARQLSSSAGLSASYVSKVESGAVLPTIQSFAKVIENLSVTDRELGYLIMILAKEK